MVNSQFSYLDLTMSRQNMSIFKMADEFSILSNPYKYCQLGFELRGSIEHINGS
jgi:hypothetical protein